MVITQDIAIAAWWARTYANIIADLGFDAEEDHRAALLLSESLRARSAPQLLERDLRRAQATVVAGAADNLALDLQERPVGPEERLFAADGALSGILDAGLQPDLVVTDLDGEPERLLETNASGIPLAVHGHGDNIAALKRWIPKCRGPLLGTRQTPGPAPSDIVTPGGLGDGDRAVFLAARLGAPRIRLVGFDLHGEPGKLSRSTDPEMKRRKMAWSARILKDARRLGLPLEERGGRGV